MVNESVHTQGVVNKVPLIVVGIPVYNGSADLRATLDSVLSQTFKDFEVFISDNASTDDTAKICQEYMLKDSRIKYVRQSSNLGVVGNFNYVLHHTTSEFFVWLSHDDVWHSTFLEKMMAIMVYDSTCVLASCDFAGKSDMSNLKMDFIFTIVPSNARATFLNYLIRILQMNINLIYGLHRREKIKDLVIPAVDFFDVYMTLFAATKGRIRVANEVLFFTRRGREHLNKKPPAPFGKRIRMSRFLCHAWRLTKNNFGILPALVLFSFIVMATTRCMLGIWKWYFIKEKVI